MGYEVGWVETHWKEVQLDDIDGWWIDGEVGGGACWVGGWITVIKQCTAWGYAHYQQQQQKCVYLKARAIVTTVKNY